MKTYLNNNFIAFFLKQITRLFFVLFAIFPFLWMFSVSLKPGDEPFSIPAKLWPDNPTFENYIASFRPEFKTYFINSLIVSLSTVVITVFLALLAAYVFSRISNFMITFLLSLVVLSQMFPHSAIIIPIYKLMKNLGLLNTYLSLIVVYVSVTLPVAIWILHGFLKKQSISIEEAAAIDGAGPFTIFFTIVMPISKPGIIATAVYVLIVTWQEFLFALSFTSTKDMRTLPVGLNDYIGQYGIRYGELMATSLMISAPIVVVFLFLQKYLVSGITSGAVKE